MRIARVLNGIVQNVEIADDNWVHSFDDSASGVVIVSVAEDEIPHIGLGWSESTGFEQPIIPDPPYELAPFPNEIVDLTDETGQAVDGVFSGE